MQDPIGSFLRVRTLFIDYLNTAFRIRDERVANERRSLLERPGQLTTDPLVEPIPRYAPQRRTAREGPVQFEDLCDLRDPGRVLEPLSKEARGAFIELVLAGLFPSESRPQGEGGEVARPSGRLRRTGKFPPYRHQVEMLGKGLREGTPGIVTSGTGSGKTESFLLPLLARIGGLEHTA